MFCELLHYLIAGVTRVLAGFNHALKYSYSYVLQST